MDSSKKESVQIDARDLFEKEIVPWQILLKIVVYAIIPLKKNVTGIECVRGGYRCCKERGSGKIFWHPMRLGDREVNQIESLLPKLPSLSMPITPEFAVSFTDQYILNDLSADWVPSLISNEDLRYDQGRRLLFFRNEIQYLKTEISKGRLFLINESRRRCEGFYPESFFSRKSAHNYLEEKGVMQKAEEMASGLWGGPLFDDISDDDEWERPETSDGPKFGFSKELYALGIDMYARRCVEKMGLGSIGEISGVTQTNPEPLLQTKDGCPAELETRVISLGSSLNESEKKGLVKIDKSKKHDELNDDGEELTLVENGLKAAFSSGDKPFDENPEMLRSRDVWEMLRLSKSQFYKIINPKDPCYDESFPSPDFTTGGSKWFKSSIVEWINRKKSSA